MHHQLEERGEIEVAHGLVSQCRTGPASPVGRSYTRGLGRAETGLTLKGLSTRRDGLPLAEAFLVLGVGRGFLAGDQASLHHVAEVLVQGLHAVLLAGLDSR